MLFPSLSVGVGMTVAMDKTVAHWRALTSDAALPFERRWTWLALRRVSSGIATRLFEQRGLFDKACVVGSGSDVETQGAALVRGYAAAVAALETSGEADDAYQLGHDAVSGLTIAIGSQRAAVDRVRELHGEKVVWVTPDECAVMLAGIEAFKFVGAVKKFFPGAEIIEKYPDEPGHSDHQGANA